MTDPNAPSWFLRIEDGAVFGPVELETLKGWAREGRIAPGHALSADRRNWFPASQLDALDMVWEVEIQDGSYFGPINLRAVSDLVFDGTVRRNSKLRHIRRGLLSTVGEEAESIFGDARERLARIGAELDQARAALDTAERAAAARDARMADLDRRAAELDQARRDTLIELAKLNAESDNWRTEAMARETALKSEIADTRSAADARLNALAAGHARDLAEAERIRVASIEKLERKLAEAQGARTELATRLEREREDAGRQACALTTRLNNAAVEIEAASQHLAEAEARAAEIATHFDKETEAWRTRETILERKIEQLQRNSESAHDEARTLRAQMTESEARARNQAPAAHPLAALEKQAQEDLKKWMRRR